MEGGMVKTETDLNGRPLSGGKGGDEQVDTFTQVSKDLLTGRLYLSAKGRLANSMAGPCR